MIHFLRQRARQIPFWLRLQDVRQEGLAHAFRRRRIQRAILSTPPVITAQNGQTEVRVLTWRRDWINQIWALKSFYHFAKTDYPLYIHDGGLDAAHLVALRQHFPQATFVLEAHARPRVMQTLEKRGLSQCAAFRRQHAAANKILDYFLLSDADRIISIDSDIVFFKRSEELMKGTSEGKRVNFYNKDESYWYVRPLPELERLTGLSVCSPVNCGLSSIWRDSICLEDIENWLPKIRGDDGKWAWVSEQTLHALCSSKFGIRLLPETHIVSTKPGLPEETVCKHYPGYYRPLLYEEGMERLRQTGFLEAMNGRQAAPL